MLTTAATLHAHGVRDLQSSAQAATALKPIAGELAFALFALGIVGTGPARDPRAGWFRRVRDGRHLPLEEQPGYAEFSAARKFYGIIIVATLAGVGINFMPIDPIKALYWSAVLNGVIAVPVMAIMMLVASSPRIMGALTIAPRLRALGWLCTGVMAAATIAMFASFL
jgi:Mn2+/Fe2+ NRAMP family transporter